MTYTREQLEKMSDDEINVALTRIIYSNMEQYMLNLDSCCGRPVDYCDSWSDIMPLAVEYGINVNPNAGSAYAVLQPENQFRFCDGGIPKAQRAIACCLLMMEIEKCT